MYCDCVCVCVCVYVCVYVCVCVCVCWRPLSLSLRFLSLPTLPPLSPSSLPPPLPSSLSHTETLDHSQHTLKFLDMDEQNQHTQPMTEQLTCSHVRACDLIAQLILRQRANHPLKACGLAVHILDVAHAVDG